MATLRFSVAERGRRVAPRPRARRTRRRSERARSPSGCSRDGAVTRRRRDAGRRAIASRPARSSRSSCPRPPTGSQPEPVTVAPRLRGRAPRSSSTSRPGITVHPGAGARPGRSPAQLLTLGAAGGDDPDRPGIVHRLDRDTSGLLVVARTEQAFAALQEAIRQREVERRYLALVRGRPRSRTGRIDAPIGRDRRDPTRRSLDTEEPRDAVTLVRARRDDARARAPRRPARDGADASDPRPSRGDRPSRLGRSRTYGVKRRPRPRAPVPACAPASLRASGHGQDELDLESPLPPDLAAALERARAVETGAARQLRLSGGSRPFDPATQPWRGCRRSERGSARPVGECTINQPERG